MRVRMSTPPASIPDRWDLCKTARRFRAAVSSNISEPHTSEDVLLRKVIETDAGNVNHGEW